MSLRTLRGRERRPRTRDRASGPAVPRRSAPRALVAERRPRATTACRGAGICDRRLDAACRSAAAAARASVLDPSQLDATRRARRRRSRMSHDEPCRRPAAATLSQPANSRAVVRIRGRRSQAGRRCRAAARGPRACRRTAPSARASASAASSADRSPTRRRDHRGTSGQTCDGSSTSSTSRSTSVGEVVRASGRPPRHQTASAGSRAAAPRPRCSR